jgi:hypothetical protein
MSFYIGVPLLMTELQELERTPMLVDLLSYMGIDVSSSLQEAEDDVLAITHKTNLASVNISS